MARSTQAALRGTFLYIVVTIYLLPLVTMCILDGHVCHTLHRHKLPGIAINNRATTRAHASKRQVIHMSIAVVVAFALCWLPAHAYHMILAIDFSVRESLSYYFMLLCYWCGHANSVVNPCMNSEIKFIELEKSLSLTGNHIRLKFKLFSFTALKSNCMSIFLKSG